MLQRCFPEAARVMLPVTALVAIVGLTGCASDSFMSERSVSQSDGVDDITRLVVSSGNGAITLREDAAVTGIKIDAEIRCYAATSEQAAARSAAAVLVTDRALDGTFTIRVDFPEPRTGRDSASFDIRLPRAAAVELRSSNGRIEVNGLTGSLEARTSNGAISVGGHTGPSTLVTSNGRIAVTAAGGPVTATTSNGSIEVGLASGNTGSVDASTSNGSVKVALPAIWQGTIDVATSNGRIEIDSDNRATEESRTARAVKAIIGDANAATVKIRTSNGAVRIDARQ